MPRTGSARIGVILYEAVEPIDLGGTVGVLSMARRLLPNLTDAVIARRKGPLRLAGGLTIDVPHSFDDAPPCDVLIVCGGPGWSEAAQDAELLDFLRAQRRETLASVCTGALILAAAGVIDGCTATTRRMSVGPEQEAPLDTLARSGRGITTLPAAIVENTVVTGGGVTLAIDATLFLIGRIFGVEARDDIARAIEYDRAFKANSEALGISTIAP